LTRFAPYSAMAGVQLGVRCAAGLPKEAMSWTVASIFPPLGLYNISPEAKAGRYKLTEVHDFSSDLRAPRWLDKASHLPQVPHVQSSLFVIDIRALEKPTTPTSLKPQGWTVLPVFGELWPYVHSGVHQLPLFEGTPTPEMLSALAKVASCPLSEWQRALGKLASERRLRTIDGASVTVALLDAQRHGELDWPEALAPNTTPIRTRLPTGFEARYINAESKASKPLYSLVGKVRGPADPKAKRGVQSPVLSEVELQQEANTAFRNAMGLGAS